MKLKTLLDLFTKYYAVTVFSGEQTNTYEDQTAVSKSDKNAEVQQCDFYEDDGDGERLLVYVKPKK